MTFSPRALAVLLCLAASACFGGPTSEWPASGVKDDDAPRTPPSNGGKADAGSAGSSVMDAAISTPSTSDGAGACPDRTFDGGADAGVSDPDDPSNPYDNEPGEPFAADAGCR